MDKKQILLIASILFLAIIIISFYPEYEINKIKSEIEQANYCNEASDCILAGSICPFGCWTYVNKAESERITNLIESFDSKCVYGCILCESVKCENKKCIPVCETEDTLKESSSESTLNPKCDTTKKTSPTGETYYSITDDCYYLNHTPLDLLEDLKSHPKKPISILMAPEGWIKKEHIEQLISLMDSEEPSAPIVSIMSSYYPFNETSTVGNEATFMIISYKENKQYPPGLHSLNIKESDKQAILEWWDSSKN